MRWVDADKGREQLLDEVLGLIRFPTMDYEELGLVGKHPTAAGAPILKVSSIVQAPSSHPCFPPYTCLPTLQAPVCMASIPLQLGHPCSRLVLLLSPILLPLPPPPLPTSSPLPSEPFLSPPIPLLPPCTSGPSSNGKHPLQPRSSWTVLLSPYPPTSQSPPSPPPPPTLNIHYNGWHSDNIIIR